MRWRPSWPTARSRCPTACRPRSRWSDPGRRVTATTPPTSRSSSRRRPAPTRAPSPTSSPTRLRAADGISDVEVAGPGFLNITRRGGRPGPGRGRRRRGRGGVRLVRRVRRARRSTSSSSRPTRPARSTSAASAGPRSATRSAGSSTTTGAEVTREYYFNDHGAQIDRFSSLAAGRAPRAEPAPEDGYGGQYIHDIAAAVVAAAPRRPGPARRRSRAGGLPRGRRRHDVRRDQDRRCTTSASTSTSTSTRTTLHDSGAVERAIERLTEMGNTYERGRRALAAHRAVRRRQGPRDHQVRRHPGLHLRRPRLLPRQARARLRPLLHHARRRPPRLRRPDEGDVQRLRRRARARTSRS